MFKLSAFSGTTALLYLILFIFDIRSKFSNHTFRKSSGILSSQSRFSVLSSCKSNFNATNYGSNPTQGVRNICNLPCTITFGQVVWNYALLDIRFSPPFSFISPQFIEIKLPIGNHFNTPTITASPVSVNCSGGSLPGNVIPTHSQS